MGCAGRRSIFCKAMIEIPISISMPGNIGKTEFANMFAQAAACIRSEHQRLTELDSIGGDGDHGTTMLRAAEQMEDWTDTSNTQSLTDSLKAAGWRVLGVDGGASSSLLGTFFAGMGDVVLAGGCDELQRPRAIASGGSARRVPANQGSAWRQDDDGCLGSSSRRGERSRRRR